MAGVAGAVATATRTQDFPPSEKVDSKHVDFSPVRVQAQHPQQAQHAHGAGREISMYFVNLGNTCRKATAHEHTEENLFGRLVG